MPPDVPEDIEDIDGPDGGEDASADGAAIFADDVDEEGDADAGQGVDKEEDTGEEEGADKGKRGARGNNAGDLRAGPAAPGAKSAERSLTAGTIIIKPGLSVVFSVMPLYDARTSKSTPTFAATPRGVSPGRTT